MCPKVSSEYKDDIINRIVESAIITFSRSGYDKSRMDDIALTANLSKGTLYLYFKNKEELFNAISKRNINDLKVQLSKIFQNKEDLITSVEKFYENFGINDERYRMYFEIIAESARNPKLKRLIYEQRKKLLEIIIEYLDFQKTKGYMRSDVESKEIAYGLICLYDGLKINKLLGIDDDQNKKTWSKTVNAIFKGGLS